jgi:diguanylate cyclase (GGDEF)-like protein
MIFRRQSPPSVTSKPAVTPATDAAATSVAGRDVDAALDTLVAVLRAYGRFAIDTDASTSERTAAEAERWVRHASLGLPLEGEERSGPRDWRALARSFADHRRAETEAIDSTFVQFRETVWTFVRSLRLAMLDDRKEEDTTTQQLDLLRAVTETGSAAELRRVAERTVNVFDGVLAARHQRHKEQTAILGAQLRSLAQQLEEERRTSSLDPLTELPNRKEFDDFADRVLQLNSFVPTPTCLLMIDVDGFKQLNDRHGHQLGDVALKEVARALGRIFLRRCDFVCRYGGDEFAAIMRDSPTDAAVRQAERVCVAVRELALPSRATGLRLSLSIGVAALRSGETLDSWMRRADTALYQAKDAGRDCVSVFED